MTKKDWSVRTLVILVLMLGVAASLWFYWVLPVTWKQVEQVGEQNITLQAETVLEGLKNPWDVAFMPDNTLLFNERGGEVSKVVGGEKVKIHQIDDVESRGEGGLTGLALDGDFVKNKYLYTCYNSTSGDVRVVRWRLSDEATELSDKTPIVTGIPANPSGRHSGCRIKSDSSGVLWIGTGDAAGGTHPQDLRSLGGKILRVTRSGDPVDGNNENGDKRIFSFGHRNVQGIALFGEPIDGVYGYSIEHGPGTDDEVNILREGNFGWAPLPPYGENVPMTDKSKFPDAIEAIWSSGRPTIAPSGGSIIKGGVWGRYENSLAVAVLKGQHLRLFAFDQQKGYTLSREEVFFDRSFGRIRSVTAGPGSNLYLTTDNGVNDRIIIVRPVS